VRDEHTTGQPRNAAFAERRRAREAALQMLYQCEVGGVEAEEALAAFEEIEQPGRLDTPDAREFAARLVIGTARSVEEIDPMIAAAAEHWRPSRMAAIDRLILRLAVYQFLHLPEVPPAVVIDEAVELARRYGGPDSGGFVNGILDAIRKRIASANGDSDSGPDGGEPDSPVTRG
jgi:N utilization substance protein B